MKSLISRAHHFLTKNKLVVVIIILVGLMSAMYTFLPTPYVDVSDPIRSPFILYHPGDQPKIEIINPDLNDIYLWGTQFHDERKIIEDSPRTVPAGYSYFLNGDILSRWIEENVLVGGQETVPFLAFLKNKEQDEYVMRNLLLIIRETDKTFSIQPQTLSFYNEKW